ncbi:hypothetical protein KRM28CT15_21040 [Krasilnikovia sp. M28-CT-15]
MRPQRHRHHRGQLYRPHARLGLRLPQEDLVGFVRLAFAGVNAAKLGYAIRVDRWGKGYATTPPD